MNLNSRTHERGEIRWVLTKARRGLAATKEEKTTTDYTDFTDWDKEDKEENEFELKNSWTDQSVGFTQDASETNLKMFE